MNLKEYGTKELQMVRICYYSLRWHNDLNVYAITVILICIFTFLYSYMFCTGGGSLLISLFLIESSLHIS